MAAPACLVPRLRELAEHLARDETTLATFRKVKGEPWPSWNRTSATSYTKPFTIMEVEHPKDIIKSKDFDCCGAETEAALPWAAAGVEPGLPPVGLAASVSLASLCEPGVAEWLADPWSKYSLHPNGLRRFRRRLFTAPRRNGQSCAVYFLITA